MFPLEYNRLAEKVTVNRNLEVEIIMIMYLTDDYQVKIIFNNE